MADTVSVGPFTRPAAVPAPAPAPAPVSSPSVVIPVSATPLPPLSIITNPISPNNSWNQWLKFMLSGVSSPGTIISGKHGMHGFKRETGWDVKKGKGTQGATLTLKTVPPVEGKITIQMFTKQDFTDWDNFVQAVLSIPLVNQQADGLSFFHPSTMSIGLTTVVIKHYTGLMYQGKGMYHAEIELLEWSQPPQVSIVATVATTAPDKPDPNASIVPVDPVAQANQFAANAIQAMHSPTQ